MAESSKSEAELDLGATKAVTGAPSVSSHEYRVEQNWKSGACLSAWLATSVSVSEKPGAGKPHAGICAGVTG